MKTFIRILLILASTFMVLGNIKSTWMALTASSLFLTANLLALVVNLKPKKM